MKSMSLYGRIALIFAIVLLAFGSALGWLSYRAAKDHQHEVMQQLSLELARHIAEHRSLLTEVGFDRVAAADLFRMATVVNPTIELYLLDDEGTVVAYSPDGPLATRRVSLAPIQAFLGGQALPILGDSPRELQRQGVFSVAPIERHGYTAGYLYVMLVGAMYRERADDASRGHFLRTTAWTGMISMALALLVGLAAFALITRRLDRLTSTVRVFENETLGDVPDTRTAPAADEASDEIGRLARAFDRLAARLATQRAELKRQDQLRRELVANLSHDLRTPLASMQNYLETLLRMGEALSPADREQYLAVAVRQSYRVARLSQQLFELALLEGEESPPQPELFSLSELVQDIAQKFALSARDKGVELQVDADPDGLVVRGDIGLIERVISNLMDNAIHHTSSGGEVRLQAEPGPQGIEVRVADTGVGIAADHLPGLLERDSPLRVQASVGHSGLGLLIARRILALHGTRMTVASQAGRGTVFSFVLSADLPD